MRNCAAVRYVRICHGRVQLTKDDFSNVATITSNAEPVRWVATTRIRNFSEIPTRVVVP